MTFPSSVVVPSMSANQRWKQQKAINYLAGSIRKMRAERKKVEDPKLLDKSINENESEVTEEDADSTSVGSDDVSTMSIGLLDTIEKRIDLQRHEIDERLDAMNNTFLQVDSFNAFMAKIVEDVSFLHRNLEEVEEIYARNDSLNAVMKVFQEMTDKLQRRLDEGDASRQRSDARVDELERELIGKIQRCFMDLRKANTVLAQDTYEELRTEVIPGLVDKAMQMRMRRTKCQG